jgi:hypothetical protein
VSTDTGGAGVGESTFGFEREFEFEGEVEELVASNDDRVELLDDGSEDDND